MRVADAAGNLRSLTAGVIACEFVSIFAALGVRICVVDSHAQLLDYLSEDVVGVLGDSFLGMGVTFHMQGRLRRSVEDMPAEWVNEAIAKLSPKN